MNEKLAEYVADHKKALTESGGKDGAGKQFPRAACIIDILRNSVAFSSADQILVLHRGEVRERGRHEELLKQGGIYKRLHRLNYSGTQS